MGARERINIVELALNRTAQVDAQPCLGQQHRQLRGTCQKDTGQPVIASSGGVEGPMWNLVAFSPLPTKLICSLPSPPTTIVSLHRLAGTAFY